METSFSFHLRTHDFRLKFEFRLESEQKSNQELRGPCASLGTRKGKRPGERQEQDTRSDTKLQLVRVCTHAKPGHENERASQRTPANEPLRSSASQVWKKAIAANYHYDNSIDGHVWLSLRAFRWSGQCSKSHNDSAFKRARIKPRARSIELSRSLAAAA